MKRLECARPPRTATGHARNAGEAVQQLAHIARERQRLAQERQSLVRRILKMDGRLKAMTALEARLMPMMRQETGRARTAEPPLPPPPPAPPPSPAPLLPAAPALAPVRRRLELPVGFSEMTLQY